MHAYRTHNCAELRKSNVGETVRLSGWVHRKRDHGHLLFVDLRDHYGITQIVSDTDSPAFKLLDRLRLESVVTVEGDVVARSAETVNPNLPTGEIEVRAGSVTVQSEAAELPMPVARFGFTASPARAFTSPSIVTTLSSLSPSSSSSAGLSLSATIWVIP